MKSFLDEDFLLTSAAARRLYHDHAARMPVIDYHCHINPQEIYQDLTYNNLTEAWLGGDHYKWRAMRSNGIDERYITGQDSTPYGKFEQWAATLPRLIGNPLYHWTHLELKRYFNVEEPLTPDSCPLIWQKANQKLKTLSVREMIRQADVRVICTTDDPIDDLIWHRRIREDVSCEVQVLPTFRPDKALNIDKPGFAEYIGKLGEACGFQIVTVSDLKRALEQRLLYFAGLGCKVADHGLDYIVSPCAADPDQILRDALAEKSVSQSDADAFKAALLVFCAGLYTRHGIVLQLHYGAVRNNNPVMLKQLGPDAGFDAIYGRDGSGAALGRLLGAMESAKALPKTIIYSLNPIDNAQIGAVIGCFQSAEIPGKIQHGSAWWFNDSKQGMIDQLTSLASLSVLGNFVGMLTDSRSFLSYTRHEYFRRILCELIGGWVEKGEYPADMPYLGRLVEDICCRNAIRYFGFCCDQTPE